MNHQMKTKYSRLKLLLYSIILALIGHAAIIFEASSNSGLSYTNQEKLKKEKIWFLKSKQLGTKETQNNLGVLLDESIGANLIQYLSTVKTHPFMGRINRDQSVTFNR